MEGITSNTAFDALIAGKFTITQILSIDDLEIELSVNEASSALNFVNNCTINDIQTLLSFITTMPEENSSNDRKYKYPYQASIFLKRAPSSSNDIIFDGNFYSIRSIVRKIIVAKDPEKMRQNIINCLNEVITQNKAFNNDAISNENLENVEKTDFPLLRNLVEYTINEDEEGEEVDDRSLFSYIGTFLNMLYPMYQKQFELLISTLEEPIIATYKLSSKTNLQFLITLMSSSVENSDLYKKNRTNCIDKLIEIITLKTINEEEFQTIESMLKDIINAEGFSSNYLLGQIKNIISKFDHKAFSVHKIAPTKLKLTLNMFAHILKKSEANSEHSKEIIKHFESRYADYSKLLKHSHYTKEEWQRQIQSYLSILSFMTECFNKGVTVSPPVILPNVLIKLLNKEPNCSLVSVAIESIFTIIMKKNGIDSIRIFFLNSILPTYLCNRSGSTSNMFAITMYNLIEGYHDDLANDLKNTYSRHPMYNNLVELVNNYKISISRPDEEPPMIREQPKPEFVQPQMTSFPVMASIRRVQASPNSSNGTTQIYLTGSRNVQMNASAENALVPPRIRANQPSRNVSSSQ